jgi:hypothetical protein
MGLEMYAFTTAVTIEAVDFKEPSDRTPLFDWWKHPNLHGWMEALYREKGGDADEFNCVGVRLEAADLDALEEAVQNQRLPETVGFFFGVSDGTEAPGDLEFIRKARDALGKGLFVYYTSWW